MAWPTRSSSSVMAPTLALAMLTAGCGGSVVKDDGGGGSGDTGSATTSTSTGGGTGPGGTTGTGDPSGSGATTGSTGTGGVTCDDHEDCPGGLCDFVNGMTGTCIAACGEDGSCGAGLICDECATGSCGPCADCLPGCVIAPPHTCDSHDDCGDSEACVFATGTCSATCGDDVGCIDGFTCDDCATSSCPGCEDCRAACVPKTEEGCTDHADCGDDLLCVFGGGTCTRPCDVDAECGSKAYCDACLTSSCPACDDCLGGCVYLP